MLNGPVDAPQAAVAWISLVGVHFVGLPIVWEPPFLRWLGASIAVCSALGLAAAAAAPPKP